MATIAGTLRTTAQRHPDAVAVRFGEVQLTYGELDLRVDQAARVLASRGVSKGDRVAVIAPNSDRFIVAFYAALRLGAIFVPVNPASAPPELTYLLADSGARTLLFDPAVAGTVREARDGDIAVMALGSTDDAEDLFALAAHESTAPLAETVVETDDALLLYTSGTTGSPKGALFDHHRSMWVGFTVISAAGQRVGDRILHVAPLYHAAELCAFLIPGTMLAATHVVLSGFEPGAVLDAMEAEQITTFFGVPTMYQFLLRHPTFRQRDLSSWRIGMFGAAPMPGSTVEALLDAIPGVELIQFCGQTEAGPNGIYATAEEVRARPDASGRRALPFMEVKIVDANGEPVEPGGTGEMLLRGETIMKGYWNKPVETETTLRDGWLHTGDIASIDADGYITLVDRLKDMIITGGRNVYSIEVENALAAHPDILDCAVIGRPHPDFGESIVAVITPREGAAPSLADIREFCGSRISSYKVPHAVVLGAVPRNASGKILKKQLRDELAGAESAGAA